MNKRILSGFFFIIFLGLLISSCSDSEIDDLKKRINELEAKGANSRHVDHPIPAFLSICTDFD